MAVKICCGIESVYVSDRSESSFLFEKEFLHFSVCLGCKIFGQGFINPGV
jgi:hypothetical protein